MTFLYPMMLWALALPLLLAAFALHRFLRAGREWLQLVSAEHAAELVARTPAWRSVLPTVLMLLALIAGILAAARPINGYTTTEAMATGRNLLIALDISRSMETQDVKPSRLEEARAAAFELVDALPSDKIGLIVFSGEADLVVPLTYDHTALRDALEQVNRGWAGYGGTNFGLVLKKAMQDFSRSAPTGTNALVIFSDGEDTVGSSLEVAQSAREHNLLVITVGVGTSIGDSIPDARGENGLYQDAEGKHVISKLDTAALQRFAEATGGSYFTMGSGADLTAFAREAVKKLDTHEESFSSHKVPRDLFAPFAITALFLLVAAVLLGTEWRAPHRSVAALAALLFVLAASPLSAAPHEQSVRAYEEALEQMGTDADKAREAFSRALLDEDAGIQAASLYQLGNVNARASFDKLRSLYGTANGQAATSATAAPAEDEIEEALDTAPRQPSPEQLQDIVDELTRGLQPYRDALSIRPSMKAAQANIRNIEAFIEKLKEEIERLKQQQQQDQQNQQQGGGQDQQDDQQDDDGQQPPPQDGEDGQDEQNGQNDQQQPEQPQGDQEGDQQQNQQEGEGEQDEPEQPQPQEQQQEQPQQPQPRPQQPQQPPMSEQQKAEQRAASILRMHVDEEKGSPIPHTSDAVRPPDKDY